MNCCDYECNQGRDCPAHRPALVAPVGKRIYTREPLPPTTWRRQLRALAYWAALALLGWLIWGPLLYLALVVK